MVVSETQLIQEILNSLKNYNLLIQIISVTNIFGSKYFLTVIIAPLTFVLNSCNSKPDISEDEVYSTLNTLFVDGNLQIENVCWRFDVLSLSGDYMSYLSKEDYEFNKFQRININDSTIKPNKLKYYNIQNQKNNLIKIDTSCSEEVVYHISFPIISVDRKKVILKITENCNCYLGGHGGIFLYEKIDNGWKRTKSWNEWIG